MVSHLGRDFRLSVRREEFRGHFSDRSFVVISGGRGGGGGGRFGGQAGGHLGRGHVLVEFAVLVDRVRFLQRLSALILAKRKMKQI